MTDSIRRFISRLSSEGLARFFQHLTLAAPDIADLKPRARDKEVIEAILSSTDAIQGQAEAISAHILLLSAKGDYAERALRAVCQHEVDFLNILDGDWSLEERIFRLWLMETSVLDRARNLAMSYHYRDGRFHCGFTVTEKKPLSENLDKALKEIQAIVQVLQGGRKIAVDKFSYFDDAALSQEVHHIAIYLETPASAVMEFREGENTPIPVLRREAREIAIDYNPETGRLDLAGKGIGGHKNFEQIAKSFAEIALAETGLTEVSHEQWLLTAFLYRSPSDLSPPAGFAAVHVTEMVLYPRSGAGGKASIRANEGQDVYVRMEELGITADKRSIESPYAVTLTLECPPKAIEEPARKIRVTISGKNARSFEGATLKDRRIVEAWLEAPPFVAAK